MRPSLRRIALRSLEAAGLVAYAYVIGGIITDARLFVAGLPSGVQTLSVVPSGQLIGTGVEVLLTWGGAALLVTTVMWGAWLMTEVVAKGIVRVSHNRRKNTARRIAVFIVGVPLIIGLILVLVITPNPSPGGSTAYEVATIAVVAAVTVGIMVRGLTTNRHVSRSASLVTQVGASNFVGAVLGVAAIGSVGSAFIGPTKLSMATIRLRDGTCVTGPMVANTTDGVYLGDGVAHSVTLIRSETIDAIVAKRELVVVQKTPVRIVSCKQRPR